MPPSQLRRLKSSLREHGVTGQQKSKKQKKQANKNGSFKDTRIQRNAALEGIREQFNPFELRAPARARKHDFVTGKPTNIIDVKGSIARPGVTKGFGEENVRSCTRVLRHCILTRLSVAKRYSRKFKGEKRSEGSWIEGLERMIRR